MNTAAVQVCEIRSEGFDSNKKISGTLSDSETTVTTNFARRLMPDFESEKLRKNSILKITSCQKVVVDGTKKMMVLDGTVLGQYEGEDMMAAAEQPPLKRAAPASAVQPSAGHPPVSPSECAHHIWSTIFKWFDMK
jgi:hypothetical protein